MIKTEHSSRQIFPSESPAGTKLIKLFVTKYVAFEGKDTDHAKS